MRVTGWSSLFSGGGCVPFLGLSSCDVCRGSSSLIWAPHCVQEQEVKDSVQNSELWTSWSHLVLWLHVLLKQKPLSPSRQWWQARQHHLGDWQGTSTSAVMRYAIHFHSAVMFYCTSVCMTLVCYLCYSLCSSCSMVRGVKRVNLVSFVSSVQVIGSCDEMWLLLLTSFAMHKHL